MKIATLVLCTLITFPAAADEWKQRVDDAKASGNSDAMLALVREALPGIEVRASGFSHAGQVHPEDNQPAPVVNFDARLNEKTTYATNAKPLETSPAYYFLARGTPYVVLGPGSLNPRSPVFTRLQAEHELFHAKRHVGDPRPPADRELETWVHVFVTLFHEVHPFKQRWAPLVSYYDEADAGEREAAIGKLVAYYRGAKPDVRTAFDEWVGRRQKDEATASTQFVADLVKAKRASSP